MEAKDIVNRLTADLEQFKASNQDAVSIDGLLAYLRDLSGTIGPSTEAQKLLQQRILAEYDAQTKSNLEMFKSVVEAGKEALNAAMLINGGAVIALLGFLGGSLGRGAPPGALGLSMTSPLRFFGAGVLCCAAAFAFRYLTQFCYSEEHIKTGIGMHVTCVVLAVISYTAFGVGLYGASDAFDAYFLTTAAQPSR